MTPFPSLTAAELARPEAGWLKSTRLGLELGLREVAERLDVSPQAVHQFEKSEVAGTISLRQLENIARAMGCRVVYAFVSAKVARPVRVARTAPSARPTPAVEPPPAAPHLPVEHSKFLDNLAEGRFD
jgi:transcriptional regulator with XRE-family HTH domain